MSNIIMLVIVMATVYRRIKDLREDRDWKQRDMAEKLHICRSTYSAYENGANAVPLETLIALAQIYKTSVDYLLELTDDPRPYARKPGK